MVSATREIICRTELSRCGVPSGPLKYFWATMLVAFCDQYLGNSTPRCSKALPPSLKFGMTASRVSHSTSSNGCTPSRVKYRLNLSPVGFVPRSFCLVATSPSCLESRGEAASAGGSPGESLGINDSRVILPPEAPGCQVIRPGYSPTSCASEIGRARVGKECRYRRSTDQ